MINPIIALIGAIVLASPSIVYHILAYGKTINAKKLATSILVGQFTFSIVMLVTGLAGLFYGWAALLISLAACGYLGNRFKSKKGNNDNKDKAGIIIPVLLLIFIGFALVMQSISPVMIEGDAYGRYLPWAKTIVETHGIPAVIEPTGLVGQFQLLFSPHYLHASLATLFSTFGIFSDSVVASVPLFFSAMTFLFLLFWAKEKDERAVTYVGSMLISSYAYLLMFHSILQEGPLLLFMTLGLYLITQFIKNKRKNESRSIIVLTAMAFSMTAQTKYNGLIFALLGFVTLIILAKDKKQRMDILLIFFLLHIPSIMWMIRNYLHYNNPFFRLLNNVFPGKWNYMQGSLKPIRPTDNSVATTKFFRNIIIEFPAIIFSLIYALKNWKKPEIKIIGLFVLVFMAMMPLFGLRLLTRYLTPFFGILSLYAAIMVAQILAGVIGFSRTKLKMRRNTSTEMKALHSLGIAIMIVGIVGVIYAMSISSSVQAKQDEWNSQRDIANFIRNNAEPEFSFDGKDVLLWGEGSPAVEWYSNSFILSPDYDSYLIATNRTVIPYQKTFIDKSVEKQLEKRGIRLAIPELTAKNFNEIAHQLGVNYIYDSTYSEMNPGFQETNSIQMMPIYTAAENNPELFTLVYTNKYGARLWSVN